jgi:excisionase family DNA binding protein
MSSTTPSRERWVTVDEVAEHLSVTPAWVRSMARAGELPAAKFGTYWRFRISDVDDAVAERARTPRKRR